MVKYGRSIARRMRSVCFSRDRLKRLCTAADHQIQLAQHRIRQVELAVLEDVDLDALQHGDALRGRALSRSISAICRRSRRGVESMRHGEMARMLGDGDVVEPDGVRRLRHLRDAVMAVGGRGVGMEIAAEVGELHQLGQVVRRLPPRSRRGSRAAPAG